ncbi:MAG: AI-2E family transporter [Steroidobacteraceae bacterium]
MTQPEGRDPASVRPSAIVRRRERAARGLAWLTLIAVAAMAWLARPFGAALVLGALLAFALEPINARLTNYTRRPAAAAALTVIFSGAIVTAAIAGFISIFVVRAVQLSAALREDIHGGGPFGTWLNLMIGWLSRIGINAETIRSHLEASAGEIASRAGAIAAILASGTFASLLGLFFALLTMYVVLRRGPRIVAGLVAMSPLEPRHTAALLEEFRRVGRTTMTGTVITGFAQGALAAIGYAITGVPDPIFFGVVTAFASLLPAVGTLLVWVPAGLYLISTGHVGKGIVELLWGASLVVGLSDYVIRPRLVRDESMPTVLVFISLFGGIETLGLAGLIIGPLIMGLSFAVLRLYAQQRGAAS